MKNYNAPKVKVENTIQNKATKNTNELLSNTSLSFFEKYAWHIISIMCMLAIFLRCYNLDKQSLWVDEYLHAGAARSFLDGSFKMVELNQISISLLDCLFVLCFGFSDFVLRLPVALLSIIGIPAIYVLGKKMFHNSVGLLAALFFTSSQFLFFWARIDRAYGLIPAIYLLLLLAFWNMITLHQTDKKQFAVFSFLNWNKKYLLYLLLAFVVAFCTQIQVFLFIFSIGFYYTFLFVNNLFVKRRIKKFTDKYAIIAYINIALNILLFTPIGAVLARPFVNIFLPTKMVDLILPNWEAINNVMKTPKWNANFLTYWNALTLDLPYFYWIACAGFILAFYLHKKSAYFLIATFLIPILLMGFVLREPNWAKYMTFYYPMFLIAGAVGLFTIYKKIVPKFIPILNTSFATTYKAFAIIIMLFLFKIFMPITQIFNIMKGEDHANLIDVRLAEATFLPYKEIAGYVIDNKKYGDIIIATLTEPISHYTGLKNVIHFRQNVLNGKTKEFEPLPISAEMKSRYNAFNYEELLKTFKENKRGWLIADYYINNITCDLKCRQFVFDSLNYHFEQNEEGLIKIFSWDHTKPKKTKTPLLIELGKKYNRMRPLEPLEFTINNFIFTSTKNIRLRLTYQGIDFKEEAAVLINNKTQIFIPVPNNTITINNVITYKSPKDILTVEIPLDFKTLKLGKNEITFLDGQETNGFVIYNCEFVFN